MNSLPGRWVFGEKEVVEGARDNSQRGCVISLAGDVFPVAFVIADQNLIVQPIHLRLHGLHVLREMEQLRDLIHGQEIAGLRGRDVGGSQLSPASVKPHSPKLGT